jgi:hypothetical protein
MRWVDLDQLELPDGWQQRSDQALNELRAEVNNAELESQRTGGNVQSARKKAISDGLDKSNRKKIWRDLAPRLACIIHEGDEKLPVLPKSEKKISL